MREPLEIVTTAIERYKPVAIRVGFSGGDDSLAVTDWMMNNIPGCQPFHANTGIGIERTRQYVRDYCNRLGWPLTEIRAKEDCGQDYAELVKERGFPGPDHHKKMYDRLKGRAVALMVRRLKTQRADKVLIASGIRHDESLVRMGYAGREINTVGAQVWVNPLYWWTKSQRDAYIVERGLVGNPVTKELGMSGECGCGAFAQPGELKMWRRVDPDFGEYIDRLSDEAMARGFTWAWDGRPPAGGFNKDQVTMFMPMCFGCQKSAVVQKEMSA